MSGSVSDVIVIGGGPAGLYAGIILKRGLPTQAVPEPLKVTVLERFFAGGLARFGYITFTKRWSFSGTKLIQSLRKECEEVGVSLSHDTRVTAIRPSHEGVTVQTIRGAYFAKYVIIATGIFPAPEVLAHKKILLALGTPQRILQDAAHKQWKKILLYGSDESSLNQLAAELRASHIFEGIATLTATAEDAAQVAKESLHLQKEPEDLIERLPGLNAAIASQYDGIFVDYNAYKVHNGSVPAIDMPDVSTRNGYILTNHFGQTSCERIYAAGNVCTVASGILPALSSALTASLAVGRLLNPSVRSEPSGRFPWFPRESTWEVSWLPFLAELPIEEVTAEHV